MAVIHMEQFNAGLGPDWTSIRVHASNKYPSKPFYAFIQHCSETTLTGESRFHLSPPRGVEPVTLVVGSKQVSPLDQ